MPRPSTGGVEVDARGSEPVYRLRFQAGGKRRFQRLGTPTEGLTREKAVVALKHTLADVERRALLATLALGGLRLGEALGLRWAEVNLARGTLEVREGKTAAATRTVYLLQALRDELAAYRARLDPEPGELVFGSATGARQGATNIRRRILAPTVKKANHRLAKDKMDPLPVGLTPHSLP